MARKELSREAKIHAMEYDNIRYSVVGTKLPREKADQFRTLCKNQGISISAALSVFVRACIRFNSLNVIRDDGTTATGSIRDNDGRRDDPPGQKNIDPAFPHGDQASENDTPGMVDNHPGFDTPGTVG